MITKWFYSLFINCHLDNDYKSVLRDQHYVRHHKKIVILQQSFNVVRFLPLLHVHVQCQQLNFLGSTETC